uniref:Phage PVL protein n=1 Tax=Staphylococcus phage Pel11 TaxID=3235046 RepID=A0AB39C7P1_9CAUD
MVKIKTIKKMNLPELIQWGWDNEAIGRFEGDKGSLVLFDANSWVISNKFVCSEEFFEVEFEEEITEDTKIANLVQVYKEDNNTFVSAWTSDTIEEINALTKRNGCSSIAFYMLNDDLSMTLIWRNGEIVG